MVKMLRSAGAEDVTWIHTKDRAKADADEAILEPLRRARGVWFGGAVSTSQLVAVLGVAAGLAILATMRRRPVPAS